jgi:SpoIIAA-like
MIVLEQGFPDNVVAVACKGHVTRSDYERVLIPAVDGALRKHDKLRLYYHIGSEFDGIDPGAVLEDMKVGFSHLARWERIAIVTDISWIRLVIRAFAFLIPGDVKFFDVAEDKSARAWIAEG